MGKKKRRHGPSSTTAQLKQLHARVPEVHCKGLCTDACGIIAMQGFEAHRIVQQTGEWPSFDGETALCSFLKEGRCSIYDIRPLICRIWGATNQLRCPHGRVPDRWLSDAEARALLSQAQRIAGQPVLAQIKGKRARQ